MGSHFVEASWDIPHIDAEAAYTKGNHYWSICGSSALYGISLLVHMWKQRIVWDIIIGPYVEAAYCMGYSYWSICGSSILYGIYSIDVDAAYLVGYIDGLVQDYCIPIANAPERDTAVLH